MWRYFFIIIFFYNGLTLNAQLLVGPKLGAQFSYISYEDRTNLKKVDVLPLLGWNAGLAVAVEMKKRYYLHFELIYSVKGKTLKGVLDKEYRNHQVNHHVDIPILFKTDFKARVGKKSVYRWYGGVGPNLSYWLKGNGVVESSDLKEVFPEPKLKYKVVFKGVPEDGGLPDKFYVSSPNRFQLGLNFGTGLVFEPLNGQRMIIDLRYELGHTFLAKGAGFFGGENLTSEDLKARNSGLRFSVAYLFDSKIEQRKKGKSTINRKKNRNSPKNKKRKRR